MTEGLSSFIVFGTDQKFIDKNENVQGNRSDKAVSGNLLLVIDTASSPLLPLGHRWLKR
ncbi:hypothetical protein M1N00_02875 [Thermodesulfovibrionales bacterium]|nr:hypothetical protein [Thermodesulfovibrionales bacterium]MCL0062179.1 hypothetical protein [Thermodesulfovibrionales bacterium]